MLRRIAVGLTSVRGGRILAVASSAVLRRIVRRRLIGPALVNEQEDTGLVRDWKAVASLKKKLADSERTATVDDVEVTTAAPPAGKVLYTTMGALALPGGDFETG